MKAGIIILLIGVIVVIAVILYRRILCGKQTSSGPWHPFLSDTELKRFESYVTEYFSGKGREFSINFDGGFVCGKNGESYGLDNIAQVYHQASEEEKPHLVAEHFDKLFLTEQEESKIMKDIADFNIMKKYLTVKIYPEEYQTQVGKENMIGRNDIDGAITALTLDLPLSVRLLAPEEITAWNVATEDLFDIGIKNTIDKCEVELNKVQLNEKIAVWLVSSGNVYTSVHIFNLKAFPQCIGKYGAIFLAPNRHCIVIYPVENPDVVEATKLLILLARKMFYEGPGSITQGLTWYCNEKFIRLPYKIEDTDIDFIPPDEFVNVMNLLAKKRTDV